MSAVMSTLSMISGGRRVHRKLTASRKSGQFSDVGEERTRSHHDLTRQQRSSSLQTLEGGGGAGVVNLESLEAKMASIEVSLGGSRRRGATARDCTRELDALRTALTDRDCLIQNLKKQLSASLSAARLAAQASSPATTRASSRQDTAALSADERKALEERASAIRADLESRRANIQELRGRLEKTHVTENIDTRIQQAELQYKLGREELELLTLGEQARALDQLIDQADAAARRQHTTLYSTVRECGGGAWVVTAEAREGSWGAAPRGSGLVVDWAKDSNIRTGDRLVEVNGESMVSCHSSEELQRATSTASPARLVVLRGEPPPASPPAVAANTFTQNEAASLRAELGALRASADEAEKTKDSLKTDNTRLTHRISYLEEQVAELLARHTQLHPVSSNDSCITVNKTKKNVTNISITSEPNGKAGAMSEVQVFQKGPDITALVAALPGAAEALLPVRRPRSNASGASARNPPHSPRASPAPPNDRMRHSLSHHCLRAASDYSAETDAAIRMIERNQRHIEKQRMKVERLTRSRTEEHLRSDADLDARDSRSNRSAMETRHYDIDPSHIKGEVIHYKIEKAADRIEDSIKKTNWAERKTLSIIEQLKRSQRLRKAKKDEAEEARLESERHHMYHRIDGKVLENAHKSSRRSSKLHSRSAKSSEFESECSDFPNGDAYGSRTEYGSETCSTRLSHYRKQEERRDGDGKSRPTPPRKPLRLSLHKARSAHSLINGSESESASRPASEARTERGEAGRKPVKRSHAGGGTPRREPATPRPLRRALEGAPPAADDLYPDLHGSAPGLVHAGRWC